MIGILELIFVVITNRVRLGTDIWAFICVMFNIVNHFVYEFRGTPAMASDIATVGTALEVADGYKIQFNFYTTVALVMLFDFIMLGRVINVNLFSKSFSSFVWNRCNGCCECNWFFTACYDRHGKQQRIVSESF